MASREAVVAFGVLGPLQVSRGGSELEFGSPQVRLVLAALLVDANVVVSADRLVEVLWGDEPPLRAASSVQKLVYRLRALLGSGSDEIVVTRAPGYVLHVGSGCLDAARFEALVVDAQAMKRRGDAAETVRLLDGALRLWRGPAFAEFAFAEFARAEAARLDELRWTAIEDRVEARLALGGHEELVGELEVLVRDSPFRERLWGELMLALYRSGRQAEALRAYARVRSLLGEELGIEPGATLRGLEEAMLLQKPELDWVPPASTIPAPVAATVEVGRPAPPSGTVTFLFTDVEGSTRSWEEHADAMTLALARHDHIVRTAVEGHAGYLVKTTGDGVHAAFATASGALEAAVEAQRMLVAEHWVSDDPLRVRMGVHTGSAEYRDGDYFGTAVNRAARVTAAAHGGQVVVSLATEELVRDSLPEHVTLVDLGEHRLRDLARPERIFQLAHPDLLDDFPRLQSLDAFPCNLPAQVSSFVGREQDVADVAHALAEWRLLTLTGVGGVGKTRLAIQVAAEVLPHFPDGAWLCELAAASEPEAMLQVIATALGVQPRQGVSIVDRITEFLGSKRLLLVLDNCEHLLDAAARFVDAVLRDAPEVRILVTSREGLAVDGEHMRALRSLSLPDPSANVEALVRSDAGRLFVDRAQAVDSSFVLDASTGAAVGELCRRLDGVPLAIELAAARIVAMSPAEIASRLDERFRLLTGGRRAAVERHQTLRATVDWSFSLCSPTDQRVFARLGVFPGTFGASAAEAVATGEGVERWDVIEALASLVGKSMVVGDRAADGGTRYSMLETLRAYARERLDETGNPDHWRRRHAEHFADFAEQAGSGLEGPDEHVWRARVRADLDNVRAAIAWALESARTADAQLGLRIVAALAYEAVSVVTVGVGAWTERAVARVHETTPGRRMAILGTAAIQAIFAGDHERARTLALDALRDGLPPDCPVPTPAYSALGSYELNCGRPDEALRVIRRGLRDVEAAGFDACTLSNFHSNLAVFSTYCGDITTARAEADEALRLARQVGNPSTSAAALWATGRALVRADPPASLAAFEGYVALARSGGRSSNLGWSLGDVSWLKARAGDRPGALRAARDGLRHDLRSGNRTNLAGALNRTKLAFVELGDAEPAAVIAGAEADGPLVPWSWGDGVPVEQQDWEHALRVLREALGAEGYERTAAVGAAMTFDEVVEYTLDELERLLAATRDA